MPYFGHIPIVYLWQGVSAVSVPYVAVGRRSAASCNWSLQCCIPRVLKMAGLIATRPAQQFSKLSERRVPPCKRLATALPSGWEFLLRLGCGESA
ncbi:hypothetical protein Ddc_02142 [Ditylenchus destructor]|nr:hypothetical protein Ddc_02142 [Ditylenchus destructor]